MQKCTIFSSKLSIKNVEWDNINKKVGLKCAIIWGWCRAYDIWLEIIHKIAALLQLYR